MHDAARRKLRQDACSDLWLVVSYCEWSYRPLWLNKSTFVMMKPAIRGEVLMADGPEMYRLYVECRNCKHEIALKKTWGPKPDRPPLTALAVQLTCSSGAGETERAGGKKIMSLSAIALRRIEHNSIARRTLP